MKAAGERIVIFGDSLSHPGSDAGPAQSQVTEGINRLTSAPGDMLASLLLEQGAEAVMIDAKVGRSAYNYWTREPSADLMAGLAAFAPTKVVVMLGTNDIGMGLDAEAQAFAALKQAFEAMGAEVWAIGPMTYVGPHADTYNGGAGAIADLMAATFNPRFIDARGLSANDQRASDGVHFTPNSALPTAQALAVALADKNPLPRWAMFALAAAGAIGVVVFWTSMHRRGGRSVAGVDEIEPDDDAIDEIATDAFMTDRPEDREAGYEMMKQLSPKARAKRAKELYANLRLDADKDAANSDTIREIIQASSAPMTADQALEELATVLDDGRDDWLEQNEDAIKMEAADPEKAWSAYREAFLDASKAQAERAVYGDLEGRRAPWKMRTIWKYEPERQQWTRENFASSDRSEAEAELVKLRVEHPEALFELADDQPTKTPRGHARPERFAVVPWRADGNYRQHGDAAVKWFSSRKLADKWVEKHSDEATAGNLVVRELKGAEALGASKASFHELVRDVDPGSMQVAEDLLLERGWKMREVTGGLNARNFTIELSQPGVGPGNDWKLVQTSVYEDRKGKLTVANGKVRVTHDYKRALSELPDVARMRAVANAWAVAKAIKTLPLDTDAATVQAIVDKAVARGGKNMVPEELFGAEAMPGKIIELD